MAISREINAAGRCRVHKTASSIIFFFSLIYRLPWGVIVVKPVQMLRDVFEEAVDSCRYAAGRSYLGVSKVSARKYYGHSP